MASRRTLALLAILSLAAVLRLRALDSGWFGVDQARDLTWAAQIAQGVAYPTVGPAMRNRVFLPATYFYFWSIPAFFSTSPRAFYAFAVLLGIAAVGLVYRLASAIAGGAAGLLAALALATSPIAVIDARVAWAPAALPVATACILLLALRVLATPSLLGAAALLVVAGVAVQLHLAAIPVAIVSGAVVLARARSLGRRDFTAATAAGLVSVLPVLYAIAVPVPAVALGATAVATGGRLTAIAALVVRALDGLSPVAGNRPRLVNAWLLLEYAAVPATLLALLGLWRAGARRRAHASPWPVPAAAAACLLAVALLPGEAWYYYLDTLLVPSAVAVGVVVASRRSAPLVALLVAVAALRLAGLAWWENENARAGYVATNLDLLRLGGVASSPSGARARVLTVATRARAAQLLLDDLRLPLAELWQRAHGVGFADLDSDNGFFFARAALARRPEQAAPAPASDGREALVVFSGDLPPRWVSAFRAPYAAGPLEIYGYEPLLRGSQALLLNCGGGPPPRQAMRRPLDYGSGEPLLPSWPCREPIVALPLSRAPADLEVRVFARTNGAAQVLSIEAEDGSEPAWLDAPGAGRGVRIAATPTTVRIRLQVDGPASLDVYELHAAMAATP